MKFAHLSVHRIVKIDRETEVNEGQNPYHCEVFIFTDEYGDTFRLTAFLAEQAKDEEK